MFIHENRSLDAWEFGHNFEESESSCVNVSGGFEDQEAASVKLHVAQVLILVKELS